MSPPLLARMLLSKTPGLDFVEIVIGFCSYICHSLLVVVLSFVFIAGIVTTVGLVANKIESIFANKHLYATKQGKSRGPCSICFEELTSGCVKLPCAHVFHQTCAYKWHSINPTCALCRQ